MKHFVKCAWLFVVAATGQQAIQAQKKEIISLQPQHVTIFSSVFSNVLVVDTRLDTFNLGFIQKGGLNRVALVTTAQPLKDELTATVNKLIADARKQDGTLCINIRQLGLSEFFGQGGETGVFRISAVFYLKQADTYRKVLTVNTRVIVKAGFGDVTQKLLDTVPEVFGGFVQQAAGFDPAQSDAAAHLTARNPLELDVEEKKTIPVYNSGLLQKGLYATFDDFKNNRPSQQVFFYYRDGDTRPKVYQLKENGMKGKEIKIDKFYAVCDGEKMYISGLYGLYPLTKEGNDFYFKSIGKEGGDGAPIEGQTVIIGRSGQLPYDWSAIVFQIDHVTGNFIPVRKDTDRER
jgi:hypothetical protein